MDNWIVDIKTIDEDIFMQYTGKNFRYRRFNLSLLCRYHNITIKVPEIPEYTTEDSIRRTLANLERVRYANIKRIKYMPKIAHYSELIEPTKP